MQRHKAVETLMANRFLSFQAVIEDCDDVVHVLVQGGATLDIKDADLWTPLHAAVACGNADLVKYLVEHGADLVAINADGNMAIDLVDENEEIEVYLDEKMTEKGMNDPLFSGLNASLEINALIHEQLVY